MNRSLDLNIVIKPVSPFDSNTSLLIERLDQYQQSLYPAESNHLDSRDRLCESNCVFLGAYIKNEVIGIGSAKIMDGYGELKRFYVLKSYRGLGVAQCLAAALEKWLLTNQISKCFLETGIHQKAALSFYQGFGYNRCSHFGSYKDDPLSVFMSKDLKACFSHLVRHNGPFLSVIFSSQLKELSNRRYLEVASRMEELVKIEEGFLGSSSWRLPNGYGITASYWKDKEAISKWSLNPQHIEAQELGKTEFYESFKTYIAQIEPLASLDS